MSGLVTISMRPVPARLRSTSTSDAIVWLFAVSCHCPQHDGDKGGEPTHLLDLKLNNAHVEVPRTSVLSLSYP
jgi:hypothetical protein